MIVTYVTQQRAAKWLAEFFELHGKVDSRNYQYLLNDQRRGRYENPIPYLTIKGRIFYAVSDLREWAGAELERIPLEAISEYVIEGDTHLERLVKLSVSVRTKSEAALA